jgi:hypothetical protein
MLSLCYSRYTAGAPGFHFFERGHLQAQIIDPTNVFMFTGSQLMHTLQVLESMEKAGITDREFLATTLIHDLGKLASLKGEKWENLEGGGKIPQGENVPGSGFENCTFN